MLKKSNHCTFGAQGEKIAHDFLIEKGYRILDQNVRFGKLGELDLVARQAEYICFIEVKTRTNTLYGRPSEAVTPRKQAKLRIIALIYLKKHQLFEENVRFDIVEIIAIKKDQDIIVNEINLIKNAF